MNIASTIDKILNEKKMSRRKLAQSAGIPPSTLQSAMDRGPNFSDDMLKKIATALDIPVIFLLVDPTETEENFNSKKEKIHKSLILEKYINVSGYRLFTEWFKNSYDILLLDDKEHKAYRIKSENELEFENTIHEFIEFKLDKLKKSGKLMPDNNYFPPITTTPDELRTTSEQREKEE